MANKLKKKVWAISTIILLIYIVALVLKPMAFTAFLPIIIPTAILTFGLPIYSITKSLKMGTRVKTINDEFNIENNDFSKNEQRKHDDVKACQKEVVLPKTYEQDLYQEEKPKIKTKGTIHN